MGSTTIDSRSPQNPADVVMSVPAADAAQVRDTIERARGSGRVWAATPAHERSAALSACATALEAAAERFTDLIVREVGKPVGEASGEVARAVAILRYYAQQALDPDGETYPAPDGRSLLMTRHFPRGVAGLITPWNFPVAIPLWKAAPALAFGNAVVLKPSPEASGCAQAVVDLLAGSLPDGLCSVVHGGGEAGEAVVDGADVVSFTGSVPVGHEVAVAAAGASPHRRRWADRMPRSSCRTPTSRPPRRRLRPRRWATPGRSAPRPAASSWSAIPSRSPRHWSKPSARSASATRQTPATRSAR
jgi:aldehyde dehydrogenase (NAD+)